jgi:hypothetical protein
MRMAQVADTVQWAFVLARAAVFGCLVGIASLALAVAPALVHHLWFVNSGLFGVSYNERLPLVVFLGVSLQGALLSWLLSRQLRLFSRDRMRDCQLFIIAFALIIPAPAILYPSHPNFSSLLSFAYMCVITAIVTLESFRRMRKRT